MEAAPGLPPWHLPFLQAGVRKLSGQAAQPLGSHRKALPVPEKNQKQRKKKAQLLRA